MIKSAEGLTYKKRLKRVTHSALAKQWLRGTCQPSVIMRRL